MKHKNTTFKREREDFFKKAIDVIFNQVEISKHAEMSAKKGIKVFGERAIAAMSK